MKSTSNSNHFYSNSRLLLGFLACYSAAVFCWLALVRYLKRLQHESVHRRQERTSPSSNTVRPTLARHGDSTSKEIGQRACHSCRCTREALVQSGPLEMEIGSSLGPPGGDVFDAAVSTADPGIALAGIAPDGSFGGTLYRSTDAGNTWSEVLPLNGISVFDIEFAADGAAYIGTQDSVRRSTDGGISWTLLNLGIGVNDQVFDVALDPSNPSIIWAGIADASGAQPVNVMRSTDSGATWSNRTPPLAAPISCRGIAVDPTDSNTVIAVFGGDFGGGQVWTTTDGGDSWTNRSAGLQNNPMQAVVYDGSRLLVGGGQLFGSENVGLYRSTDVGATWTPLHDGTWPVLVVDAIAVDPNDAQTILVAMDGSGVNRTTDGGGRGKLALEGPMH